MANRYYHANLNCGGSIPATEHSVMCAGQKQNELDTFDRLLTKVYPNGPVSIVSDTYDIWSVLTSFVPKLKNKILKRSGNTVIRPDCYDDNTEILTNYGFKLFANLQPTDLVAQYNNDKSIDWVIPSKYYAEEYSGPMYAIKNNYNADLLVTPNHRMVVKHINKETPEIKVAETVSYHHMWRHLHGGVLKGELTELTPLERIWIAFQADGSFNTIGSHTNIRFNFTKQRKIDRMTELCDAADIKYIKTVEPARPANVQLYLTLPDVPSKTFDWVLTKLNHISGKWAQEFIEEASHWDSCRRSDTRFKYDTTIPINAEVIQTLAAIAGYRTSYSVYQDKRKDIFSDVHTVHTWLWDWSDGQSMSKELVNYTGKVYCVQVPSGMLVVRRNKKVSISGNSGDPVKIILGDENTTKGPENYGLEKHPSYYGVLALLRKAMGVIERGFGLPLIDHAAAIYGDAITLERAKAILAGIIDKLKLSTYNMVFGIGSFTYQYVTRDTNGFAMKRTAVRQNGEIIPIFKSPITDDGGKVSHVGITAVYKDEFSTDANPSFFVVQNATEEQLHNCAFETVFLNGELLVDPTLDQIRERARAWEKEL
jgi:hypothetical protein